MTALETPPARGPGSARDPYRYRLQRAGVLNVWQYDDQVFEFADGRLLLRGANGAGKSKTLEMLLPFVLDGDKLRITASHRHHTSLLWLMSDGFDGQSRVGYLWVELGRQDAAGVTSVITCGVGIRWSASAKQVQTWFFTSPLAVGDGLVLDDGSGPVPKDRLRAEVEGDGHVFESARAYKEHVGRTVFGLEPGRYDELLRLVYWLRQPQVGEDIEPSRLADQLANALPVLDDEAVRTAGGTFDELAHFGTQLERRAQAAEAVAGLAEVYRAYAVDVARSRGAALVAATRELSRRDGEITKARGALETVEAEIAEIAAATSANESATTETAARRRALEASPEARSRARLLELEQQARTARRRADEAAVDRDRAASRVAEAEVRLGDETRARVRELVELGERASAHAARLVELGVDRRLVVPAVLAEPTLRTGDDLAPLEAGADTLEASAAEVGPAVGAALAAVGVVDEARRVALDADRARTGEERRAAEADERAEGARERRAAGLVRAEAAEEAFRSGVEQWLAAPGAVSYELPERLDAEAISGLAGAVRALAAPTLAGWADDAGAAAARGAEASGRLRRLEAERQVIADERDPAPPPPALARSPRPVDDGAPFWRLVGPIDGLPASERAGVEAALEQSGLLDAWVRRDGAVLDDRLDVVLVAGPAAPGRTLADALRPEVPDGSVVAENFVAALLQSIGLVDTDAMGVDEAGAVLVDDAVAAAEPRVVIGLDGTWRAGQVAGRASKPVAQYLGSTARAAERVRRLAAMDAGIAVARADVERAATDEAAARTALRALETWLAASPPPREVLHAWAALEQLEEQAVRSERDARAANDRAAAARAEAVRLRRALDELATAHGLPTDEESLARRRIALTEIRDALAGYPALAASLRSRLATWVHFEATAAGLAADAEAVRLRAGRDEAAARELATGFAELEATAGAGIEELRQRLAATADEAAALDRQRLELISATRRVAERRGAAASDLETAIDRQREQQPMVVDAAHALAELDAVPGLLEPVGAAVEAERAAEEPTAGASAAEAPTAGAATEAPAAARPVWLDEARAVLAACKALTPGEPVALAVRRVARAMSELAADGADANAVHAAFREVEAGPGHDVEPRLVTYDALLAVMGRDEAGDHPVVELATRLAHRVEQDRLLLTEREREVFEQHVLGGLGDTLRLRRTEAAELVAAMNELLADVSTSQGIRVRLDWRLRDDVGSDARQAVKLLARPTGALLPDERSALRDALHRLIEQSRSQAPEDSYTEHLARALDYRQWSRFKITYSRPEVEGWIELTRRSALSQGEQKVVCYLPLFAAAAAHFSSLAGAAPYAPRFVLLDDAFPKIDVRTHPLLFGLLVDLDLDFVITSERLWGDHATVPSLAIYEALRDPGERGIAQYRHTWNGRQLSAVGA